MKTTLKIVDPLVLSIMGQLAIAMELGVKLDEKLSRTAYETLASSVVVEVSRSSSSYHPRYGHPVIVTIIQHNEKEVEICRMNLWIYTNGEAFFCEHVGEIESNLESVINRVVEHVFKWIKTG